jgi:hypothetical protein
MKKNSVDKGCIQDEIILQAEGHIITKQRHNTQQVWRAYGANILANQKHILVSK